MKYGIWNTALPDSAAVDALQQAGYSPLTARVLAGRGCGTPQQAQELLCADAPLFDPFLLREMDRAVQTVRQALQLGQRIAVFGDYDVDGITATCLLTDFLRGMGADCVVHIPGRLEEGYGLNAGAIRQLHAQGVRLIITVDCGITALEEAELCRELGVTLVVIMSARSSCRSARPLWTRTGRTGRIRTRCSPASASPSSWPPRSAAIRTASPVAIAISSASARLQTS